MSKIALTPNASGSGTFTIASPNSNTDRTLTLPDEAGTVLTSASSITPSAGSAFSAVRITSTQSISSGTWTKIQCNGETFDVNNEYDNTTNYRFQPTTAGYYQFNMIVNRAGSSVTRVIAGFYKNSSEYWVGDDHLSDDGVSRKSTSTIAYMNGSTDYMEAYGYIIGSGVGFDYAGSVNQMNGSAFQGFLVRAA